MRLWIWQLLCIILLVTISPHRVLAGEQPSNLEPKNLVAWCIVPFDAKQRTPSERAAMLK